MGPNNAFHISGPRYDNKPVFGETNQVILKPVCSATMTSQYIETLHVAI